MGVNITLNDKYELTDGRAYMTAIQALVRIPLVQRWRDTEAGLNTAAFISGYRGSPLGHYDSMLRRAEKYLRAEKYIFRRRHQRRVRRDCRLGNPTGQYVQGRQI